ncbi:hypothetical protein [Reichenbachiella ulvae]|uniref:Uncharacterized protein n=1 Tax=Reichenbachiella ulvae TaxID=2980104 RepID=A0ABT3D0P5_9BACT|nr:hypothetical protein [Reichenbachiella ulvae]MCV9385281.1 hypothetical protein [Reichenbachiella ulvae]MCV9389310.1 hypothetical protein [Reichenbachiella ulvae]
MKYQDGFNKGYLLMELQPQIAKELIKNLRTDSEYGRGLYGGIKQYELDQRMQNKKNRGTQMKF